MNIVNPNPSLMFYRLSFFEAGSDIPLLFDCQAEDDAHAIEQIENANPGCLVLSVDPFAKWFIYSPNESSLRNGDGFWSGTEWVSLEAARVFGGLERDNLTLPCATGDDARWVTHESIMEKHGDTGETIHLNLNLNISFAPNGASHRDIVTRFQSALDLAIGNGLFGDAAGAVVKAWGSTMDVMSDRASRLSTDDVAAFMERRIYNGEWLDEDIRSNAQRLARYMLSDSVAMRNELTERMLLEETEEVTSSK